MERLILGSSVGQDSHGLCLLARYLCSDRDLYLGAQRTQGEVADPTSTMYKQRSTPH